MSKEYSIPARIKHIIKPSSRFRETECEMQEIQAAVQNLVDYLGPEGNIVFDLEQDDLVAVASRPLWEALPTTVGQIQIQHIVFNNPLSVDADRTNGMLCWGIKDLNEHFRDKFGEKGVQWPDLIESPNGTESASVGD